MTELAGPLAAFLQEHLPRDRGASPHTVAGYAVSFKLLAVFAAERHKLRPCRLQVGHLDIPTLLAFLNHLETDRDNGVRTRNARLSAIKSFFRYLEFRHPECLDLAAQVHALPQKKADLHPSTTSTATRITAGRTGGTLPGHPRASSVCFRADYDNIPALVHFTITD